LHTSPLTPDTRHAHWFFRKRSIKKAKDLHVRKLVKKLKATKQTDALEAELRQAKEVDVEGLWTTVLLEGAEHTTDVARLLVSTDGVVDQLQVVEDMREKLKKSSRGSAASGSASDEEEADAEEDADADEDDGIEARAPAGTTDRARDNPKPTPATKKKDIKEKKKPKNRMGQRARQRLAEKQYGKDKALHIVENRARDQKRREQQDRRDRRDRRDHHRDRAGGDGSGTHPRGVNNNDDDDPATLHPSWQAKKAATKLVIPANPGTLGKNKIVFD